MIKIQLSYAKTSILLVMIFSITTLANTWEPKGMGGGGTLINVAINPHNSNEIFVGTDMSEVFHSTDFGKNWTIKPSNQLSGSFDADIRFTSDPDIMYSINWYDPHLLRFSPVVSIDAGQTFQPLPNFPPVASEDYATRIFADPNQTQRIVLAYDSGIYFSDDGGNNYVEVASFDFSVSYGIRLAGVVWDGTTIIVATAQGMYRSNNNGTSFAAFTMSGIPATQYIANFEATQSGASTLYIAATAAADDIAPHMEIPELASRVYRSTDGTSWQEMIIPNSIPYFIETFANDVNTLYLAGAIFRNQAFVPAVWRSNNGGDTWQQLFLSLNNENIQTGWSYDDGNYHWWWDGSAKGFDVDPNNSNKIFMSSNFAYSSVDGGATWQAAYVKESDLNPINTAVTAGLTYQTNGLNPTSSYWIHWIDQQKVFACFTDISSHYSTDGGEHWQVGDDIGLDNNSVYQVVQAANGTLYAAVSELHDLYLDPPDIFLSQASPPGGSIHYSTDNGASWSVFHNFNAPVVWLALDPNDSNSLYVSVVDNTIGGIHVTHELNNGVAASFSTLSAPVRTQKRPYNITILNDGTIVSSWSVKTESDNEIFTASSGVFISTDGGTTWLDRSDINMHFWTMDVVIDLHDATQNTWYTAVRGHQPFSDANVSTTGGLYKTTNRGQTWTRVLSNTQASRVHSITIHPSNPDEAYVTTEGNGLLKTSNLTAAVPLFIQDQDYLFQSPLRTFYNPFNENEIWVTSFGNGMHKLNNDVIFINSFE